MIHICLCAFLIKPEEDRDHLLQAAEEHLFLKLWEIFRNQQHHLHGSRKKKKKIIFTESSSEDATGVQDRAQ